MPGFWWERQLNRLLLAVEVILVVVLLVVLADVGLKLRELNAAAQRQQHRAMVTAGVAEGVSETLAARHPVRTRPRPAALSRRPPVLSGTATALPPEAEEPAPERAHRLQIPAIGVDSLIYQGWDESALRQGVGQRPGSPAPGEPGNLLLSAHNDIHGAIFRHLDRLQPGDALYISTENVLYTYFVRDVLVVSPDSIWVTLPTAEATATLISCYPYLFDTQRIVVFADFAG